jgi:hypothetical protein
VLIIRFSVVPSHFSTAVFSTCDVKFWHFALATFLTLPKQIFIVYLGVLLVAADQNNKIETIVLSITFVITIAMGVYVWFKLKKIKVILLEEQAQRRANHSMARLRTVDSDDSGDSNKAPVAGTAPLYDQSRPERPGRPGERYEERFGTSNAEAYQQRPVDPYQQRREESYEQRHEAPTWV